MKSNNNEITLYERWYRRFHPLLVKCEYQVCVSRFNYWMMKHDPDMKDLVDTIRKNGNRILDRIDLNDAGEIRYLFGVMLIHPGMRLYLVYNNGARRRIKLGRFSMRRFKL